MYGKAVVASRGKPAGCTTEDREQKEELACRQVQTWLSVICGETATWPSSLHAKPGQTTTDMPSLIPSCGCTTLQGRFRRRELIL